MSEWRVYIEGCRSITVITDHATLRHLPMSNDAEQLAKIPRKYVPWLNILSPYFAINMDTNEPILKILYRKGKANDADALSRRPDLVSQLHNYENCTFEKELEEFQSHLSAMSHFLFDENVLTKVKNATLNDPVLNGNVFATRSYNVFRQFILVWR